MVKTAIKQGDIVVSLRACDDSMNIGIAEDVLFHMNDAFQEEMVLKGKVHVKPAMVMVNWIHAPFYEAVTYDYSNLRLYCPGGCEPEPMIYCGDRTIEETKKRLARARRTGGL